MQGKCSQFVMSYNLLLKLQLGTQSNARNIKLGTRLLELQIKSKQHAFNYNMNTLYRIWSIIKSRYLNNLNGKFSMDYHEIHTEVNKISTLRRNLFRSMKFRRNICYINFE